MDGFHYGFGVCVTEHKTKLLTWLWFIKHVKNCVPVNVAWNKIESKWKFMCEIEIDYEICPDLIHSTISEVSQYCYVALYTRIKHFSLLVPFSYSFQRTHRFLKECRLEKWRIK